MSTIEWERIEQRTHRRNTSSQTTLNVIIGNLILKTSFSHPIVENFWVGAVLHPHCFVTFTILQFPFTPSPQKQTQIPLLVTPRAVWPLSAMLFCFFLCFVIFVVVLENWAFSPSLYRLALGQGCSLLISRVYFEPSDQPKMKTECLRDFLNMNLDCMCFFKTLTRS